MIEIIIAAFVVSIFICILTYKGMFRQSRIGCSHLIITPIGNGRIQCYCGLIKSEDNPCTYKTCPIVNAQIV